MPPGDRTLTLVVGAVALSRAADRPARGTPHEWRDERTKESGCRHVFRAYAKAADGEELLFKEAVYSRADGS